MRHQVEQEKLPAGGTELLPETDSAPPGEELLPRGLHPTVRDEAPLRADPEFAERRPSVPPGPQRRHPRQFASTEQAGDFEVRISLISARYNAALTRFFTATAERTRIYWLLASLARHQSVRTANAMAFDLFLALVPLLGLAGWTASIALRDEQDEFSTAALLRNLTPAQVDKFIGEHFQAMSAVHLAPFALLAGWWLVSSAFNTMMDVFEESFACDARGWFEKRLISLVFALVAMLLVGSFFGLGMLVALAPAALIRPIVDSLRYFGVFQLSLALGALGGVCSFLALLYRYAVRRERKKRRVWPGALTATILGTIATAALGYYASNIASYALFYGGLAAIIVVLLWLWLWSTAILVGAEINVALEDLRHEKSAGDSPPA